MKVFVFLCVWFLQVGLRKCIQCPAPYTPGLKPPSNCTEPYDPQNRPASAIESWFTEEIFNDLFPKANLGWGVSNCRPYNYKAFIIAARYFPSFGNEYVTHDPTGKKLPTNYTSNQTYKRDLAAFFAHAIQETGENDANLYRIMREDKADDCFYRGGFYNWFEGGPISSLVKNNGLDPKDGEFCIENGEYCDSSTNNKWFYPCNNEKESQWSKGCYFGRGPLQISYNFNYGLFSRWLKEQNITEKKAPIDILANPNLLMTKYDPPLGIMASLWFYMTPQSPKPAMHDIIIGDWVSPDIDYSGGVFGPTSLVINTECDGEDKQVPGGPGENRRIKAFRWFTKYFGVPFNSGLSKTISCKGFNKGREDFNFYDGRIVENSWDVDWHTSGDTTQPCKCMAVPYCGLIIGFDPKIMPKYKKENEENKEWCKKVFQEGYTNQNCSKYKPIKQLPNQPIAVA